MPPPRQKHILQNLLIAFLYFAAGLFGELLATEPSGPSLVFPAAGVAVGAVLLWGSRIWPGIVLGTMVMAWWLGYSGGAFFILLLVCPAVAVLVPGLLKRWTKFRARLETHQDALWVGVVAFLAGGISAGLSVSLLTALGFRGMTTDHLLSNIGVWCLGDATGVLLIAPIFLSVRELKGQYLRQERQAELLLAFVTLILIGGIVFWGWLGENVRNISLIIAPYPFVIWIATRFERLAATLSSLILSAMAISGTARGFGPYNQEGLSGSLVMLAGMLSASAMTVLLLNVTLLAHRHTEAQLAQHSSLLQNILSHLPGAVYWKNTKGVFLGANREFAQLANIPNLDDVIGKMNTDLPVSLLKEGLDGNRDLQVIGTGEPLLGMEFTESTISESPRTFLINKVPLHDTEGQITGLVGMVLDISAIKEADRMVTESLRRLHRIVDHLPAGAVYVENEQVHYNDASEAITGYAEGELTTRDEWFAALYPDSPHVRNEYELARSEGFPHSREVIITRKDGEKRWVVVSCYADDQGEIWLLHDSTDRHQAQESLRVKELELAHVTRLSSLGEMVAELAHEINQPLHTIANFSMACLNMLESQSFTGRDLLQDWLQKIHGQADQAGKIIRRLRRLTAPTPPQIEEVDIEAALEEVLELFQADAHKLGIGLRREFPEGIPPVLADRVQLQQIFINLIKNAHEALSEIPAHREMTVKILPQEDELEVIVSDNGPGFSQEAASKMFDAFYTTKSRGMGMGLPICRSLAMAQGGNLWMKPVKPQGAEIHFTLPTATPTEQKAENPPQPTDFM